MHLREIGFLLVCGHFFRLARSRLNRRGRIFVNVHAMDDLDDAPDRISMNMAEAWPNVRLLDCRGRRNRNAIVMAGAVLCLKRPVLHMRPQMSAAEIDAELGALHFRSWHTQS
jgi:hypothetical protein